MDTHLDEEQLVRQFEALVLPHLDAAYSLARWLTLNTQDAEDLAQMAYVRAYRFFPGFQGGDARAWLLTIVRHTYYTSLRDHKREQHDVAYDEAEHTQIDDVHSSYDACVNPEIIAARQDAKNIVNRALEQLPQRFREVVVLKELQDLSYKEIAEMVGIPLGTVMSRLARGRKLLLDYLKSAGEGGTG
ncbi:sigma-70 family RNA polymerase sigma factor [Undibacterium sp.]|jgi:RNA polymerase sigma-70 factor (ECF subfamily)|uniref:sigma-70 family RNA polymerase sigma factor n=1 Tax=Undibacterium sp. TaxID=1914977 RepID=UPI002CEE3DAB|nr:sigma-70 family RNA polymerase sigma factor [Undibacterium sp.]HTD05715.1 sigma-70 family RNA polymerase sigma factor [Undibacterium sp.]